MLVVDPVAMLAKLGLVASEPAPDAADAADDIALCDMIEDCNLDSVIGRVGVLVPLLTSSRCAALAQAR